MTAGARATAQVPRALLVLGTTSAPSGPAQASAAASATPWQPTASNTAREGEASRGVSRSRAAASKNRAGTPSCRATAHTAGSSIFRSREATQATAPGASPAVSSACRARAHSSAGAVPRSQPRPRASTPGWSTTSPAAPRRSVTRTLRRPLAPNAAPPASHSSHSAGAASAASRTGSPASRAAVTSLTRAPGARRQPGGGASRAKPRAASPAVVIAAWPPRAAAMARASRFAPRWPPSSGTALRPSSETATTGGSACFSPRRGARTRIRMPAAQMPTIGRPASNSAARCGAKRA